MRLLPLALCLLPSVGLADVFMLESKVTEVTVYGDMAKVTRVAPYTVPQGDHALRLLDLPPSVNLASVQATVLGAKLGALNVRDRFVPPRGDRESTAVKSARAEIERLQDGLLAKQDQAQALALIVEAAEGRIAFLSKLGEVKALEGTSADQLRDIVLMVGEETLAAKQVAHRARIDARSIDREIVDLEKGLREAEQVLHALVPEGKEFNLVEAAVTTVGPVTGEMQVTYLVHLAGWRPANDAFLTLADTPSLDIQRLAWVGQDTGENWQDVTLTLSSSRPSDAITPGQIYAQRLRIEEKQREKVELLMEAPRAFSMADDAGAAMTKQAVAVEQAAVLSLGDLVFNYKFPQKVSLASGADAVRIELGQVSFAADIKAIAVPQQDENAFLAAEFTNTSGEPLLPSQQTQLFLNGEYVGVTTMALIAAGADGKLPFGAIDGLRLNRVVDRAESDRGIISKSNEIEEVTRIEVENLTGRNWPLRVLDSVPYSEQEDLVIKWEASPPATVENYDDGKGILAWEFDLGPGKKRTLGLRHTITWPKDMILR